MLLDCSAKARAEENDSKVLKWARSSLGELRWSRIMAELAPDDARRVPTIPILPTGDDSQAIISAPHPRFVCNHLIS